MSRSRDIADSPFLGTKLISTTVSDDATVDFNSTYVTSTYDHYDLQVTGLIPATDNTFLALSCPMM